METTAFAAVVRSTDGKVYQIWLNAKEQQLVKEFVGNLHEGKIKVFYKPITTIDLVLNGDKNAPTKEGEIKP